MKIRLLVAGGTIDKKYNELTGELEFYATNIPKMLERGRSQLEIVVETMFLKDSLEMENDDRRLIFERCKECKESNVIITHGTDTMVEMAEILGREIQSKTIILVGAMIPYSISNSDALFNLGSAISSVQLLGNGVYIVMNGNIFSWDNVFKNKEKGIFQRNNS